MAFSSDARVAKRHLICCAHYFRGERLYLYYPDGCLLAYHYALLVWYVGLMPALPIFGNAYPSEGAAMISKFAHLLIKFYLCRKY